MKDRAGEISVQYGLAMLDLHEGKAATARQALQKVLRAQEDIGSRAGAIATRMQLATIEFQEGGASARSLLEELLREQGRSGNPDGVGATLFRLGLLDVREGNLPAAAEKFSQAQQICLETRHFAGWNDCELQLALISLRTGKVDDGLEMLFKPFMLWQLHKDHESVADAFRELGLLADKMGRGEAAARLLAIAYGILAANQHGGRDRYFDSLADLCARLGYPPDRFEAVMKEAGEAYQADNGVALIKNAFLPRADRDEAGGDG